MIVREFYATREDGVSLYKTYSDTGHLIRKVSDGAIYADAIDVQDSEEYEEVEGYVDIEGPDTYDEVLNIVNETSIVTRKINRISMTKNESLSVKDLYPRWEDKIGSTIEAGFITLYDGRLWKARQTHTALDAYPPSLYTASLYEVIDEEHEGTITDPIPYTPPMEIFEGKYYTQFDVVYRCFRSSGVALSHNLSDLIGLYVETTKLEF